MEDDQDLHIAVEEEHLGLKDIKVESVDLFEVENGRKIMMQNKK